VEQIASTGDAPIARNGAAGVYIERESRALFFGGVGTDVRFNDVWALEGLAPAPPPTAVEAAGWGEIKEGILRYDQSFNTNPARQ